MKQTNEPGKKKVRTLCVKVSEVTYKKLRYMAVARDQNNSEVITDAIDDLASATGLAMSDSDVGRPRAMPAQAKFTFKSGNKTFLARPDPELSITGVDHNEQ